VIERRENVGNNETEFGVGLALADDLADGFELMPDQVALYIADAGLNAIRVVKAYKKILMQMAEDSINMLGGLTRKAGSHSTTPPTKATCGANI